MNRIAWMISAGALTAAPLFGTGSARGAPVSEAPARQAEAEETLEGSWEGRFENEARQRAWVQLRHGPAQEWGRSLTLPRPTAETLYARSRAGVLGEVTLTLRRAAGVLDLEGRIRRGRGRGLFTFTPDPSFHDGMAELGFRRLNVEEMLAAAVVEAGPGQARALREAGFDDLDFDDLLATAIFRVDTTFIQQMRALGFEDLSIDQLVSFRIHGVTPDFVRQAREMGFGELDPDDFVSMRIHKVTPEFVEAMAREGFRPVDIDQAIAFRIHKVTPEFVRRVRELGFEDVSGEDLLKIRIYDLISPSGGSS